MDSLLLQERLFGTSDQDPVDFPNSAFSMGSFVDDTLSSRDYTDIHGPNQCLLLQKLEQIGS